MRSLLLTINTSTEKALRCTLLIVLLAVFLGRIALTYRVFNDTFDESSHIIAGLEILERGTYTFEAQHPPLARLVVALLPYYVAGLRLQGSSELWGHGPWARGDLASYWRSLALGRAGNLVFAALLFCLVYRWSSLLYGAWAGVAACLLATCSPNLLAHAGLATVDIAAAATVLMASYFFWRWSREPGLRYCLASAAAFGLAVWSKFSALVFLPPLLALYFLAGRRSRLRNWNRAAVWAGVRRAVVFGALFLFVLWAGYRFEVGTIVPPGHRFISPFRMGREGSTPNLLLKAFGTGRIPAHTFVQGLIEVASHNEEGQRSYLLGHYSQRGWWYYFPVAVAVKSTLPLLLLVAMAVAAGGVTGKNAGPALAIAVILGVSLPASINIGVRHVLALYPFFAILASSVFQTGRRAITAVALGLAAWHAGESIATHPDYLAYFNEAARGREERFLVDSNLDWGQDLARLGRYLREHPIEPVYLSYFGHADPARLGVNAIPLGERQPQQGWLAVSVTNLIMRDDLAWLRGREPDARVGKSIWLYHLPGRDKVANRAD